MKKITLFIPTFLFILLAQINTISAQNCTGIDYIDLDIIEDRYPWDPFNYVDDCTLWKTEYVSGGYFYCGEWELEFEDNFNGTEIDDELWTTYFPDDRPVYQRLHLGEASNSIYLDENVSVSGGTLKLVSKSDPGIVWQGIEKDKSTAVLHGRNEHAFHMGRYEFRAKMPVEDYNSAAFWVWNGDEIDIVDSGNNDWYTNQMISKGYRNTARNETPAPLDLSSDFHTYSMDWDPYSATFYRDGCETAKFYKYYTEDGEALKVSCGEQVPAGNYKVNPVFTKKIGWYRPILSIGVHGDDLGEFSQTFEVDYVRLYERTLGNATLKRSSENSPTETCISHCDLGTDLWVHFDHELLNFFKLNDLELDYGYVPEISVVEWETSSNINIVTETETAIRINISQVITNGTDVVIPPYWVKVKFTIEGGPIMELEQKFKPATTPEIIICDDGNSCTQTVTIIKNGHCTEDLEVVFSVSNNYTITPNSVEYFEGYDVYEIDIPSLGCGEVTVNYSTCISDQSISESLCEVVSLPACTDPSCLSIDYKGIPKPCTKAWISFDPECIEEYNCLESSIQLSMDLANTYRVEFPVGQTEGSWDLPSGNWDDKKLIGTAIITCGDQEYRIRVEVDLICQFGGFEEGDFGFFNGNDGNSNVRDSGGITNEVTAYKVGNQVTFDFGNNEVIESIRVYNIVGQIINVSLDKSMNSINLNNYNTGILKAIISTDKGIYYSTFFALE